MFLNKKIQFLCWLDQRVRRNLSTSDFSSFLWSISDKLSARFLKKLEKNMSKDRILCRELFELYEDRIWLLAQHMDRFPKLQNSYLSLFKLYGKDKTHEAYLEDRVLVNYKDIQKYGTQIIEGNNYFHRLYPISGICEGGVMTAYDVKALNQRRAKMGLESMEMYAKDLEENSGIFLLNQIYK